MHFLFSFAASIGLPPVWSVGIWRAWTTLHLPKFNEFQMRLIDKNGRGVLMTVKNKLSSILQNYGGAFGQTFLLI